MTQPNSNIPSKSESSGQIYPEPKNRVLTRRNFIRTGAVVGAGLVASTYVKPDIKSIKVPRAFASASAPPTTSPPDGECVVTYWKDYTHRWSALGYHTGDSFNHTFGVNAFSPDKSLLEVVHTQGGWGDALGRHAVAALLNCAATGSSTYGLSAYQIKKLVKDAYSSGGVFYLFLLFFIDSARRKLESLNEDSCLKGGKLP